MTHNSEVIIQAIAGAIRDELADNYDAIHKAAVENFKANEDQGEPVCKVSLSLEWTPEAEKADAKVRLSWSTKRTVETEVEIDTDQEKFPFVKKEGTP